MNDSVIPLECQGYIIASIVMLVHFQDMMYCDSNMNIHIPVAKADKNIISPFNDISLMFCS